MRRLLSVLLGRRHARRRGHVRSGEWTRQRTPAVQARGISDWEVGAMLVADRWLAATLRIIASDGSVPIVDPDWLMAALWSAVEQANDVEVRP